jgi:hypothetical protein
LLPTPNRAAIEGHADPFADGAKAASKGQSVRRLDPTAFAAEHACFVAGFAALRADAQVSFCIALIMVITM